MSNNTSRRRRRATATHPSLGAQPRPGLLARLTYAPSRDPVNSLFSKLVSVLKVTGRWFNRLGQLVYVHPEAGLTLVTPKQLNGYLSSSVEIHFHSVMKGRLVPGRFGLLTSAFASAFVSSPRVAQQFPRLSHYTRSPLFDRNWTLVSTPGYHEAAEIYYDGPAIFPARGTALLDRMLSEFCWKSAADRVNFIGLLLTTVTILSWIGKHPLAAFNGNKVGVGKSLLARLIGLVAHGFCATVSFNPNDEEFEKQLATGIEAGDRVLVIDNAKQNSRVREVSSGALERCVTDPLLNFRRLGSNTSIRRPNDVIFCLTMNATKMGSDLRRRSVPVNLEWAGHVRDREFSIRDLEAFVMANRFDLLSEVLGMVQRWVDAGCPVPAQPARHSVCQEWAATIDGILRANGYPGFLGNFDEAERAFDPDYEALVAVCHAFHESRPMTATEWAKCVVEKGLLDDRLRDEAGFFRSDHAQATIVGNLLSEYVGAIFEREGHKYQLQRKPSKGRAHVSPQYWFEHVDEAASVDERGEFKKDGGQPIATPEAVVGIDECR